MLNVNSLQQRKERHHQILHIQYRLGTKFQLQMTVFWTKLTQNMCFQSKKWKTTKQQQQQKTNKKKQNHQCNSPYSYSN